MEDLPLLLGTGTDSVPNPKSGFGKVSRGILPLPNPSGAGCGKGFGYSAGTGYGYGDGAIGYKVHYGYHPKEWIWNTSSQDPG